MLGRPKPSSAGYGPPGRKSTSSSSSAAAAYRPSSAFRPSAPYACDMGRPAFQVPFPDKDRVVNWAFYKSHRGTHAVKYELNDFRKRLIRRAFQNLDTESRGVVTLRDLRKKYNAKCHPDVVREIKSEDDVLREVMIRMEGSAEIDGQLTYPEFERYYERIGQDMNDDYFAIMICQVWKIEAADGITQREEERNKALAVEITEREKTIFSKLEKMVESGTVSNAEEVLKSLSELLKIKYGAVKFIRLGCFKLLTELSKRDDEIIRRKTLDVILEVVTDRPARTLIDANLRHQLADEVFSPLQYGLDPVVRQKAAYARTLI